MATEIVEDVHAAELGSVGFQGPAQGLPSRPRSGDQSQRFVGSGPVERQPGPERVRGRLDVLRPDLGGQVVGDVENQSGQLQVCAGGLARDGEEVIEGFLVDGALGADHVDGPDEVEPVEGLGQVGDGPSPCHVPDRPSGWETSTSTSPLDSRSFVVSSGTRSMVKLPFRSPPPSVRRPPG